MISAEATDYWDEDFEDELYELDLEEKLELLLNSKLEVEDVQQ